MGDYKCSICFYESGENNELMKHYVKFHKHDPDFKVQCSFCGSTYKNWKSFLIHQSRKHNENADIPNAVDQLIQEQQFNREQIVDDNLNQYANGDGKYYFYSQYL